MNQIRSLFLLFLLPALVFGVSLILPAQGQWVQVSLHAVMEATGAVIALIVGLAIALFGRDREITLLPLAVSLGLLCMGILDGLHAMMPPGNRFVLLHSLAMLCGGLMFAGILLPLGRSSACRHLITVLVTAVLVSLVGLAVVSGVLLPDAPDSQSFLARVQWLNNAGGVLCLVAALKLNQLYNRQQERNLQLFALHCALFGLAGLSFEVATMWQANWWWWHLVRFVAYVIALSVLIARALRSLKERYHIEKMMQGLSDNAATIIYVKDTEGRYLHINRQFEKVFDLRVDAVLGRRDDELFPEELAQQYMANDAKILRQERPEEFEETVLQEQGARTFIALKFPLFDFGNKVYAVGGILTDITERKKTERVLSRLAHFDLLTKLFNRQMFRDRVEQAINNAQRHGHSLAVLFIDFDRFKNVNDSLGHPVGDKLLIEASQRLKSIIRAEDSLARFGGDEFTCLLPEITHREDAAAVAEKMVELFDRPFNIDGNEITLTVSIGISLYPDDAEDIDTLIKHADSAMYRAKDKGRCRFEYYSIEMTREVTDRLALEGDLRRALLRDEFELHWQPQFSMQTLELVAVECLLRWRHPQRGLMRPEQFIAVAEDSNLIVTLGDWVLKHAIQKAASWAREGHPLRVAINISAHQLESARIVEDLETLLHAYGLSADLIELELTESSLMSSGNPGIERLRELKAKGVSISIDDFGTGYSSLSRLKTLPLDRIKIDRSFIMDIPDDVNDIAITRSIIAMARALDLEVVAEGIETPYQCEFLKQEQCDIGQGFYYSKAVTTERFESLLVRQAQAG